MMFHLLLDIGAMVNGHGIWFRLIRWESISLMGLSKSLSGLWYGSIPLRSHNLLVGSGWW